MTVCGSPYRARPLHAFTSPFEEGLGIGMLLRLRHFVKEFHPLARHARSEALAGFLQLLKALL
jgi:hypothetical protein